VLVAAIVATGAYYLTNRLRTPAAAPSGSLRVESDPSGAEVRVNGALRGTTPLSLSMAEGQYTLSVQYGGNSKQLPVGITAGATTVHHITWADTLSSAPETGNVSITTEPAGGQVSIDGEERGVAPLTLRNLPVGPHRVVVRAAGTTYARTVQIEPGATASLFFGGSAATSPGWISVDSPIAVQVLDGRRLIGTSDVERIMLSGGEHEIELVSEPFGFRTTRKVRVAAGQTATISVELPRAPLSINAVPWAEVFIDGSRIGETPLANVQQTVGQHELVFRHPQLGERRLTALVTLKDVNRVSMDMRKR
jgi:hypothetical protein